MITPTDNDIGRGVLYVPRPGHHEAGVITSFNERFVFVRYGADQGSKATHRANLEWAHVEIEPDLSDPRFGSPSPARGGVR